MTVTTEISRVHKENYGVYGIRKIHAQLARENIAPAALAGLHHGDPGDEQRCRTS